MALDSVVERAVAAITRTNPLNVKEYLLLFKIAKMKWEFPGGKMEPGETPEQAVVREVKEEIGYEPILLPKKKRLIRTIDKEPRRYHVYAAELPFGVHPILCEPEKFAGLLWLPYGNPYKLKNLAPFTEHYLRDIGAL